MEAIHSNTYKHEGYIQNKLHMEIFVYISDVFSFYPFKVRGAYFYLIWLECTVLCDTSVNPS